jgi:hypothetical protein
MVFRNQGTSRSKQGRIICGILFASIIEITLSANYNETARKLDFVKGSAMFKVQLYLPTTYTQI